MPDSPDELDARLHAAGVAPDAEPVDAWRRLRAIEGPRVTVLDLYELTARRRGLTAADLPTAERHALARSVMPDLWPGFEQTEGTGRTGDVVRVVDSDPDWPQAFASWHDAIRTVLGATARRIEHVGSTSVPGLAAKPIVDVQVSVDDIADEPSYVPALESLGLRLRSRDDYHRYFRPAAGRARDVHVHVCPLGSAWEAEHLLFRDYLRAHADARAEYAQAKRAAAAQWPADGWAYTEAKGAVVRAILDRAAAQHAGGVSGRVPPRNV